MLNHAVRIGTLLGILVLGTSAARAQTINYRAQGHYYSAKAAFQAGRYAEALSYVYRSKEALGGTNAELQYLHILSAYDAGNYDEAQKEMQTFFAISEGKAKPVFFSNSVDRLTDDELKQLTMLIDKIDEAVIQARVDEKAKAARSAEDERLAADLTGTYDIRGGTETGATIQLKQYATTDGRVALVGYLPIVQNSVVYLAVSAFRGSDTPEIVNLRGNVTYTIYCHGAINEYGAAPYENVTFAYDKAARAITIDVPEAACRGDDRGMRHYELRRR